MSDDTRPSNRSSHAIARRISQDGCKDGTWLRKQIIKPSPAIPAPMPGGIDVAAVATVLVTSEDTGHPIDHILDDHPGPGGSRWVAGEPGEQEVILAFDAPQVIRRLFLEVEELELARTQELQLAVSSNGGRTYRELVRQEYNFSPPGTTFEREDWAVAAEGVTHLRLIIKPDKGGNPCRATITSLALWGGQTGTNDLSSPSRRDASSVRGAVRDSPTS